ncbi:MULTISPECIES: mechanosensitive ion channel family protein [unclassified Enterococcus]|uniref:mechanosensitive ion channel family protein n=1 Tax=unclassified Enterococcus TaxID=2608891 RepID=UPI0015564810|nr:MULTISPECIES: mechanosensitive ion channel family protein [unclassified Enterococcus]MBS7578423.1 mechanosensitive ion channel family protein [Enterococcus sp. MMGLQ5-2]MBS7585654.1 mechanosensitive ion channel family protein [Enterococcus sp. MMGLQ5-1]NPD13513.1 mechanosensitive ion channel family protein [Enterococcus sp. MMGLQ5-1]NPD38255.1 mechanosensitive ion channel family protein [Enterococcus sp. MMGLQ5-2]
MFLLTTNTQLTAQMEKQVNVFERLWQKIDWDNILSIIVSKSLLILITSIIFFVFYRVGKVILNRSFKKYSQVNFVNETRTMTVKKLTESIFQYAVLFFYIYTVLSIFGIPVGSLIAGAGIAGIALGLGAQGFMNDLITGMFIFIERQFDVGDRIKIQGNGLTIEGNVISIGIRSTRVKDFDGSIHFIPNRNIVMVTNFSRSEIRTNIDFQISSNTDIDLAEKLILDVNRKLNQKLNSKMTRSSEYLGTIQLPTGQIVLRTAIYSSNLESTALTAEFNKAYFEAFQNEKIELPDYFYNPHK